MESKDNKTTTTTTISAVAKECGVSKTTISRYINGKYEYMSDETRKRIQSTIEKLEYRPNNLARSLKSKKSGLIGVLVADITNPFSSILVKGIGDICKEKNYQVIIANTDNDPKKEREYLQSLMDNRVEGFIINTTGRNNEFLAEIGAQGVPIVLADRLSKELKFDTVVSNNYEITYETIKYLIDQGYKRIAFFSEEIGNMSSRTLRRDAFLDSCKNFLKIDSSSCIYEIDVKEETTIINSLNEFMTKYKDESKALFAVNGVTLLNLIKAVSKLNIKMPNELGVCGYDDWGWASLIPPGITVISQPSYEVGVKSAESIISRITNKTKGKPKFIELSSKLIKRGSTALK